MASLYEVPPQPEDSVTLLTPEGATAACTIITAIAAAVAVVVAQLRKRP